MVIEAAQVSPHITELFDLSCINLFQGIDQDIQKVDSSFGTPEVLTAYINADSSDLNIALLLSIPKQLLSQLLPANLRHHSENQNTLGDSIMELSNQLLGKLKNQLVSSECWLDLGLPQLCVEADFNQLISQKSDKNKLFYKIESNHIECVIAVDITNKDMTINPVDEKTNTNIESSELELF